MNWRVIITLKVAVNGLTEFSCEWEGDSPMVVVAKSIERFQVEPSNIQTIHVFSR